jgi:hypothetical protein
MCAMHTNHVVSVKGEDVLKIGLLFFGRGAIVTTLFADWVSVNQQNVWQDLLVTARSGTLHRTQSTLHAADGGGLNFGLGWQHTDARIKEAAVASVM